MLPEAGRIGNRHMLARPRVLRAEIEVMTIVISNCWCLFLISVMSDKNRAMLSFLLPIGIAHVPNACVSAPTDFVGDIQIALICRDG